MPHIDALTTEVYEIIHQATHVPLEKISSDAKLEDLVEDSIQLFQLILSFEEAFGMRAKYEDLMKIITVGDIVDYLRKNSNR